MSAGARAVMHLLAFRGRPLLQAPLQEVARNCGFGDPERMRRAFISLFGRPPSSMKVARTGKWGQSPIPGKRGRT